MIIVSQITDKDSGFKITPVTPYKEDHIFKGWYYNNEKIDLETYEFVSNGENTYTLIALWMTDSYTIKYSVENEKELGKEVTVIRGYDPEEYIPVKEGHEFSGWTYYKNGEVYDIEFSSLKTGDVIEAKGYMAKCSYQVDFNTNGGTYVESITVSYGDPILLPSENPKREGYSFDKWLDVPVTMPAHNITINSSWNLYICKVGYELNDIIKGSVEIVDSIGTVSYDISRLASAKPTDYGDYYTFDGWFTSPSGGTQITDNSGAFLKNVSGYTNANGRWISTKSEITLYAHWSKTRTETYIETVEDFKNIAKNLSGNYLIIVRELDLSDVDSLMFGEFHGTLDGNGCILKNWSYTQKVISEIGLFSINHGVIKNITLFNFNIGTTKPAISGILTVGILCGRNYGTIDKVIVQNSSIKSYVGGSSKSLKGEVSSNRTGMICGWTSGTVKNCVVDNCKLAAYSHTRLATVYAYVGGISGVIYGTGLVKNSECKNTTLYGEAILYYKALEIINPSTWDEGGASYLRVYGFTTEGGSVESCSYENVTTEAKGEVEKL